MGRSKNIEVAFLALEDKIKAGVYGKLNSFLLHSKDLPPLESYFNGYTAEMLHEFQSVTKSLQCFLLGIAVERGLIKDIDIPIKAFFEEVNGLDWGDGKAAITIRHLMQMTAGLDWNEGYTSYLSLQNHSNCLAWSNNWVEYALSRPMRYKPGESFLYSSANPILLSAIFNKVYEGGHEAFVKKYLFEPLQISQYWYHRSAAHPHILADVDLLPKDMAKFGKLVAQGGMWKKKRLLSRAWVDAMLNSQVTTNEVDKNYSFGWWHTYIKSSDDLHLCHYAWGYGSQHIFILPSLDVVMVCTGKNYETTLHKGPFDLLREVIGLLEVK